MNPKASQDSSTTQRPESPDAPVEIKIPQRMVNLPVVPSKRLLRKIALLVLMAIALVAGWLFVFFFTALNP